MGFIGNHMTKSVTLYGDNDSVDIPGSPTDRLCSVCGSDYVRSICRMDAYNGELLHIRALQVPALSHISLVEHFGIVSGVPE